MNRPNARGVFCALVFAGAGCVYLSLSPLSMSGMGYLGEDTRAANEILRAVGQTLTLQHGEPPLHWARHGALSLVSHFPFLIASHVLFGTDPVWEDRALALEPILLTSLILFLLCRWTLRLSGSARLAWLLTVIAGFATILWPYSYIGLETGVSFFLLWAAFLALASDRPQTWAGAALFALSTCLAVTAKSSGTFLLPAVAFLIWRRFRGPHPGAAPKDRHWGKLTAVVLVTAAAFLFNAWTRQLYWKPLGGLGPFVGFYLIRSPIDYAIAFVSLFGSANKGLFFYCPPLLLALAALPRAWRRDRPVAVFALLTLLGLAGGFSFLAWSDETWGPRYLHAAIAPLLLCLAAARRPRPLIGRAVAPLLALGTAGLAVSFLGAFFYYGSLHVACGLASQSTLEALQSDPVWNHVRFNARLFGVWREGPAKGTAAPAPWIPAHTWWFSPPPDAPAWKTVDLAAYARPQPLLARPWPPDPSRWRVVLRGQLFLLCLGLLLLAGTLRIALSADRARGPTG